VSTHRPDDAPTPRGYDRLRNPEFNKGTTFTGAERERYGLRGLLPAWVSSLEVQETRALANLRRNTSDIDRYVFLLTTHIKELMPLVYTPTVGQACQEFAHTFRQTRGFYISPDDRRGGCRKGLGTGTGTTRTTRGCRRHDCRADVRSRLPSVGNQRESIGVRLD
jgi:hypothetical protein